MRPRDLEHFPPVAASAHTPGPWAHYDDSSTPNKRHEIVALGKTIAHIYCSVPEQDGANAKLIAAAPDLAACCQEFLPILERQLKSINPDGAAESSEAFKCATARVGRMHAALAKAGL